jgi:hypothetical protein
MAYNPSMRSNPEIVVAFLLLAGCGGGVDVSTRSVREARRTWQQAHIRDYDLEWRSTGPLSGHYLVYVRDGRVDAVRRVLETPREIKLNHGRKILEAHPGDPELYGVDGLFRVLEQELDAAQADNPFGAPQGSRVLLKFVPDEALGYPRTYRRDVIGSRAGLSLDVLRLDTHPPKAIPPLPGG